MISSIFLSFVKRIDRDEILRVFIEADYINQDDFEKDLLHHLKDDNIKKIEFTIISAENPYFSQTLMTTGLFEADILILNGSRLSTFDLEGSFRKLQTYVDILNIDHTRLFMNDEEIYGIEVSHNAIDQYQWIMQETSYSFINEASIHENELMFKALSLIVLDAY